METRAIFNFYVTGGHIEFYIGIVFCGPYYSPYIASVSFRLTNNIDSSSYAVGPKVGRLLLLEALGNELPTRASVTHLTPKAPCSNIIAVPTQRPPSHDTVAPSRPKHQPYSCSGPFGRVVKLMKQVQVETLSYLDLRSTRHRGPQTRHCGIKASSLGTWEVQSFLP